MQRKFLILLVATLFVASTLADDCTKLYSECGYKGKVVDVCQDVPDTVFQIKSIKLGKGQEITIYKETNYKGETIVVKNDLECIGGEEKNFYDKFISFKSHNY